LHVDDRSSGYPRYDDIGHDFVTAAEYRTLLANYRDMPTFGGDIVVSGAGHAADGEHEKDGEAPKAAGAPGGPGASGGVEVRLKSRDELLEFFLTAGKKGVAV